VSFFKRLVSFAWGVVNKNNPKYVYVRYFKDVPNVGDLINVDIIEHYSGKKVVFPVGCSIHKHYLCVGSVIHNMNKNSTVVGSGLLSPDFLKKVKRKGNIKSVRGNLTVEHLKKQSLSNQEFILGDPALIFPKIYSPKIEKKYKFGLILHYVDEGHNIAEIVSKLGGAIIDVKQSPVPFINQLLQCEKVLSSSMHGLILADAYNVPNKRIKLSNKLTGGDFKFRDYYSTTTMPDENFIEVSQCPNENEVVSYFQSCTVKQTNLNLTELENVLINEFTKA